MKIIRPQLLLIPVLIISSCSQHKIRKDKDYYFYHMSSMWVAVKDLDPAILESNPVQRKIRLFSDTDWRYVFETDLQTLKRILSDNQIKVQCSEKDGAQVSDYRWNHDKLQTQCNNSVFNKWKTAKIKKLRLIPATSAKNGDTKND